MTFEVMEEGMRFCVALTRAIVVCMGSLTLGFGQSTFSVMVQDSQLTGSPGNELVCNGTVTNISNGDVVLSFIRRQAQLPPGWESSICVGDACFPSSLDSIAFTSTFGLTSLPAGGSRAFSVHFITTAQAGSGTVRVVIRNNRIPSDTLGVQLGVSVTATGVLDRTPVAESPALLSCYPNPFNPTTTLRFTIGGVVALSGAFSSGVEGPAVGSQRSADRRMKLVVYDLLGREVAVLVDGMKQPGWYEVTWDARGCASGAYICRLSGGDATQSTRLMLLR
jgi:hypothetical protein